jgi:hypothetical protein
MKLMTAKIVYWTVITVMIGVGVGLGISALWFVISMLPFGLFFILGILVIVGLGLAMGWAESVMDKDRRYKQ